MRRNRICRSLGLKRWVVAIAATPVILGLAACGSDDTNAGSGDDALKVAVLMSGTQDDTSWGNDIANGAKKYGTEEAGADVTIVENLSQPSDYLQQGTAFANQGYDLIIMGNGAASAPTKTLAEKFPKVKFGFTGAGVEPTPDNVAQRQINQGQGDFVAGVLAGLMTETDEVGAVIGSTQPRLVAQGELFILGARAANPEVSGHSTQINTWNDSAKAKAAGEALAAKGVDIVFSATEQAVQGLFTVAQSDSSGLEWVIPQYMDSYELAPDVVLTSVVYNMADVVGQIIKMAAEDNWEGGTTTPGLKEGVGLLAPYHGNSNKVPEEIQQQVKAVQDAIIDGSLELPSMMDMGRAKAGTTTAPPRLPS